MELLLRGGLLLPLLAALIAVDAYNIQSNAAGCPERVFLGCVLRIRAQRVPFERNMLNVVLSVTSEAMLLHTCKVYSDILPCFRDRVVECGDEKQKRQLTEVGKLLMYFCSPFSLARQRLLMTHQRCLSSVLAQPATTGCRLEDTPRGGDLIKCREYCATKPGDFLCVMKAWISEQNVCTAKEMERKCGEEAASFYADLQSTVFEPSFPVLCEYETDYSGDRSTEKMSVMMVTATVTTPSTPKPGSIMIVDGGSSSNEIDENRVVDLFPYAQHRPVRVLHPTQQQTVTSHRPPLVFLPSITPNSMSASIATTTSAPATPPTEPPVKHVVFTRKTTTTPSAAAAIGVDYRHFWTRAPGAQQLQPSENAVELMTKPLQLTQQQMARYSSYLPRGPSSSSPSGEGPSSSSIPMLQLLGRLLPNDITSKLSALLLPPAVSGALTTDMDDNNELDSMRGGWLNGEPLDPPVAARENFASAAASGRQEPQHAPPRILRRPESRGLVRVLPSTSETLAPARYRPDERRVSTRSAEIADEPMTTATAKSSTSSETRKISRQIQFSEPQLSSASSSWRPWYLGGRHRR